MILFRKFNFTFAQMCCLIKFLYSLVLLLSMEILSHINAWVGTLVYTLKEVIMMEEYISYSTDITSTSIYMTE